MDAIGLWCALGYAALAVLARRPGEPELAAFFLLVAWTGLPVAGLYLHVRARGDPFPIGRLIAWAVVFRLCGLVGGPFFEDDFSTATCGTATASRPPAPPTAPRRKRFFVDPAVPALFQGVLDGINYPELPTIYAPVTQWVFLLGYWLQPASVAVLQAILIAIDLAVVALLLRLAPARNVLLYAWCPLVIKEVAFTAHPDGAGVCLLLAAIVLARHRRWPVAAVCLGLAAGSKDVRARAGPAGARRGPASGTGCCAAARWSPCMRRSRCAAETDLASLQVFAREWEFNSGLFGLLASGVPRDEARLLLGAAFAGFWGCYYVKYWRGGPRGIPRGDWLYGALLAASPVINPWYLLWLLPFATIYPSVWAWTASVAVLLSYITGLNMQD